MKITQYISVLFIALPFFGQAQITDNFTDGNFTSNPAWSGNDTDFIVNASQQLQLSNQPVASASYLSLVNSQSLNNCEWNFWINLNFSPSSNNYARVYLVSDTNDLSGNLNGYYLQFGENLANDQVELFRKSGTLSTSVCRGTTLIATAFTIRVKVTRDNAGLWQLLIDPTGGINYVLEASGIDNTFSSTSYFGVYCRYTSTNATNFFFDDFYIYSPPDIIPPVLDSVKVISQNQLDVYFNEAVDTPSAQTAANFSVNNGIGAAQTAVRDGAVFSLVHLAFANNFTNGQTYALTVAGVQDLSGNAIISDTANFLFFIPQANDIVINEIMADTTPVPNALPPCEYLELYNRTNFPAKIYGWTISDASSTTTIPNIIIQPDSLYVLTSTSCASVFGSSIQVTGFSGFPGLNNTDDDLVLRDANGNIISVVLYKDTWYNDLIKQNGGWSLEQIDPNNPCGGINNWKASLDNSGGTPGRKNSVNASNPDITAPKLLRAYPLASDTVELFFDEPMDKSTLGIFSSYTIDNGIGNPTNSNPVSPDYSSVVLALASPIVSGIIYAVTVNSFLKDCAGNSIGTTNTAKFAIAQPVSANDVVVNEVLFDPNTNGVEWLEIYNRSNKVINLKDLSLCSQDGAGNLNSINQISAIGYLIFPQDYFVLSTDSGKIKSQYDTPNPEGFLDMSSIPSLSNDSDHVLIINQTQTIIDKLFYHSDWHLPLLNDSKGFSLERINYENTTQDESNWHSAAESVGGATPAYKNSQYTNGEGGGEITISPEVFSPDNDGYNDVLSISYAFDTPGMIGNVQIYDSRGRLEKNLVRNELLATSGVFFWDGITDDKLKARIGIYVIYFEAFDTNGKVKKYKKSCVVGGKF